MNSTPKSQNISHDIILLNTKLYSKLLEQLNKDFNLCGIEWVNYHDIQPENLFSETEIIIQQALQKEGDTLIYALLYRIDISEKAIRHSKITNTSEITTLVLTREIEKIWLREQYSM